MAADQNTIMAADLARAREIDFAYRFNEGIQSLLTALGTTRKIAKRSGTLLKAYKATGTLEDGTVGEGETIPLSKYKVEAVDFKEITIQKWRKATTLEGISEGGYEQAAIMTLDAMLKDVQKGIRTTFFTQLGTGTGTATGENVQQTLANSWGQLQVAFEDIDFEMVSFMNPVDVASYLGNAQITVQNAFGMTYAENFLGLGTVIFSKNVPQGKIYSTAQDNIVCYYLDTRDGDIQQAFTFTTDETGLIGVHEVSDYTNLTVSDTVVSGVTLWAERIDGVIVATITPGT